ncbi:MAG: hypothetical protein IJ560_04195 [Alphaproteobacteria bacterium]|nr:hypothetical protein [Alphaproteobacteria bacterium]
MKIKFFAGLLMILPFVANGAERTPDARVGVNRISVGAGVRAPNMSINLKNKTANVGTVMPTVAAVTGNANAVVASVPDTETNTETPTTPTAQPTNPTPTGSSDCRDAYRACMDDFCLLDESEGNRCACSANINKSKSLILEIQAIQEEADKLYTEGVEREQLGAKARLVFGESEAAKKSSRASGLSFSEWLNGTSGSGDGLGADADIGEGLYDMAADYCSEMLDACGTRAEMEEMLYTRQIVSDCKGFESYLADQKVNANANKRTAEAAVRKARLEMLDTTNKYNRGECLLAYKACIADKGGCGANFENCLDVDLLGRRANACENVLDQCMAVRTQVQEDWVDESTYILTEAAKYADKHMRSTCLAQIQMCLEDGCSTSTNSACLTNINVAAGICPIITECDAKIPGLKTVVSDKLGYMQTQFCENDIDKCLQDRCGKNYTAPECVGKSAQEIAALCPQSMFPSCKNAEQFNIIVSAALLQMDYQMLQGCLNYFGEQLGNVCGTDMKCLPNDDTIMTLTELPRDKEELASRLAELRSTVRNNAQTAVNEFFTQFEKDKTVAACKDSQKPAGQNSLGDVVFNTAKMIAEIGAENRALRELETKITEISKQQDVDQARELCLSTYKVEEDTGAKDKPTTYVKSVSFEPSLRNCHVCRIQRVCETGGESKATGALKAGAGMMSTGASVGTMVSPGWGTAIGAAGGLVLGGVMGALSSGKEDYCQEVSACEDINM